MAEPARYLRDLVEVLSAGVRDGRTDLGDRTKANASALLRELGFVTRGEYEELELRVAQLEHRLRLVERPAPPLPPPTP